MTTPLAYSIKDAAAASGLSISALDRAIRAGHLRAKRSAVDEDGNGVGKYLILADSLQAYLDGLVDA